MHHVNLGTTCKLLEGAKCHNKELDNIKVFEGDIAPTTIEDSPTDSCTLLQHSLTVEVDPGGVNDSQEDS